MNIQDLIDEIVAKLRALYTLLGDERLKVANAIEALTGVPIVPDEGLTPAVQAKIDELDELLKQHKAQLAATIPPPA